MKFPLILDMLPYCEDSDQILKQPEIGEKEQQKKAIPKEKKLAIDQPPIDESSPLLYELFAVIIHSGGAYGGHYYAFIHDVTLEHNELHQINQQLPEPLLNLLKKLGCARGAWYNFNDSKVSAIDPQEIATQYGGKGDCAYMLIYRSKDLHVVPKIEVPLYLKEEILNQNLNFEREKEAYEKEINEISLTIYSPSYFFLDSNESLLWNDFVNLEEETKKCTITIDQRKTLYQLKEIITAIHGDYGNVSDLMLIQVVEKDKRMHYLRKIFAEKDASTLLQLEILSGDQFVFCKRSSEFSYVKGEFISIQVVYHTDHSTKIGYVRIRETKSLKKLKRRIREQFDIPEHVEISISKRTNHQSLTLRDYFDDKSLFYLNVEASSVLVVEEAHLSYQTARTSTPEKIQELSSHQIEIFVNDLVSPAMSTDDLPKSLKVIAEPTSLVKELKDQILLLLPCSVTLEKICLSRYEGSNEYIFNETSTLEEENIKDQDRINITISSQQKNMMHLLFHIVIDGRVVSQNPIEVEVDKRSTIFDCKTLFAAHAFKEPEKCRLRRLDLYGMPDNILDDEELTLEDCGIKDSDFLWLEEGKIPIKGQISLNFFLYQHNNGVQNGSFPLSSPALHLAPNYTGSSDPETFEKTSFGFLDVSAYMTLRELKEHLISEKNLQTNPDWIRVWKDDYLLRKEDVSLKKLNIDDSDFLNIEISTPELEKERKSNSILLYFQMRDGERKSFLPPKQHYVGNSLEELFSTASNLTGIDLKSLKLFKFNKYNSSFQEIQAELVSIEKCSKNQENKGKQKQEQNKPSMKKRYGLRDGDIIVCVNDEKPDDLSNLVVRSKKPKKSKKKEDFSPERQRIRDQEVGLFIQLDFD